jgi:arabinogalactan endo-1,4-beta-galactosidase
MKQWIVGSIVVVILLVMSGCKAEPVEKTYPRSPLSIEPIQGISDKFIRGVDISTLIEMEENGQKYYDSELKEADLFDILDDHGVNWIRVRVWNNPYNVPWSTTLSKDGLLIEGPIGGGTNDLEKAIELSKRAKAKNMNVLVDFHYSDFWADPGKQFKPAEWENLSFEELKKAVYDFTYNSLEQMSKEGCLPDMVQIGNEVNSGLIFPEGRDIKSEQAYELIAQGVLAVRTFSKEKTTPIKVMIHLAEGGDRSLFVQVFDHFTEKGLDYDVIGVSFYPYWHGSLTDLKLNLKTLEERYQKEVVVAEVAYANGYTEGDTTGNIFNETMEEEGGYKASVLGQATCIRDIMEVVSEVSNQRGLGIFYWEPAWLTPAGTGWVTGEGNGWENQAMFDINGRVLDSMDVFYAVYQGESLEAKFSEIAPVAFKIDQGQKVTLPYRVKALFSNHKYESMTVKWENLPLNYSSQPGNYEVKGVIEDLNEDVLATIEVIESNNVLTNGGFEEGIEGYVFDTTSMKLGKEGENPFTGHYAFNYWAAADFQSKLRYTASDLTDTTYELTCWIMGSSLGKSDSKLVAISGGKQYEAKIEVTGFNDWKKLVIQGIKVVDGSIEFGVDLDEVGGSWGWIDDFKLSPTL